jgi:acyl-CoA reductase-like NAD-dependent aldehyde dehydrogenase
VLSPGGSTNWLSSALTGDAVNGKVIMTVAAETAADIAIAAKAARKAYQER